MKVKISTREDGLQVVTCKTEGLKIVRLGVLARAGSFYDPDGMEGLFHFFEHMAFKGTTTKNVKAIQLLLDRYFIDPNAFTGPLYTVYGGAGYSGRLNKMCDVIFDLFINPTFPEVEIEKEKNVVHSEFTAFLDDEFQRGVKTLKQLLYRQNPTVRNDIGSIESLKSVNRDTLLKTHQVWYSPANAIVIAVGSINHERLRDKAFKFFPIGKQKPPIVHWIDESKILPSKKEEVLVLPREQSVTLYGCKIPQFTNERERLVTQIMMDAIAGGFSSLLFQEMREKRGLCYSVGGNDSGYYRSGYYLVFFIDTSHQNAEQAKRLLLDLICGGKLSRKTFTSIKNVFIDKARMEPLSLDSLEEEILEKLIDEGKSEIAINNDFRTKISLLKSIEFEEVVKTRERLLKSENMACVMIRPK